MSTSVSVALPDIATRPFRIACSGKLLVMGFLTGHRQVKTRYLIEVPHDPDECTWVMDEIIGRGPQYASLFWWGCHVGEHRAWTWLDGHGRGEVLEEALPPVLRDRAIVHRVSRIDGPELRDWHDSLDARRT